MHLESAQAAPGQRSKGAIHVAPPGLIGLNNQWFDKMYSLYTFFIAYTHCFVSKNDVLYIWYCVIKAPWELFSVNPIAGGQF